MRKEIVAHAPASENPSSSGWMNLEAHGCVRLTSEDASHLIEKALRHQPGEGWRAASPGEQTIWIDFDVPQPIREIHLYFEVGEQRTQEFVLLMSTDNGRSYRAGVSRVHCYCRASNADARLAEK